jgi:hypothetical protein
MKAEIVITGLCSILNPEGKNKSMGEPSFIAVQTAHEHDGTKSDHHVTYLAFDSTKVQVDSPSGFLRVPKALQYLYLPLNGEEIAIAGLLPGYPVADPSYAKLVRKDDYWPEAKDDWNRDYVPPIGHKPKKTAAKAWMRFGKGTIGADRISLAGWEFTKNDGTLYTGNFAEEVVYSDFLAAAATDVVIEIQDLDAAASTRPRILRFTPISPNTDVTLIVGNNIEIDMAGSVKRIVTENSKPGDHFKFMNAVADPVHKNGPIPAVKNPPGGTAGGGENSGPCGPGSGNN